MKSKLLFISILAVLFVFPLVETFAQPPPNSGSIEVISTFDYPGIGNQTLPQKINDKGDVVGSYIDSSGVERGFIRFSHGGFSEPIVNPNDTAGFTEGRDITKPGTVIGDYLISDGTIHSYFLSRDTFTEYDLPGTAQTNFLGINEHGDVTGGFDPNGSGAFQGFILDHRGTVTSFAIPGAASTFAYEITNSKKLLVGYFVNSGILHGYYRDDHGALHFPIDPPGSVSTVLFGLNDKNLVVGRYADGAGVTHGLLFVPPNKFFTYDFPGATFTSINGINLQGILCGRYSDASGIAHGFTARLKGPPPVTPAADPAGTEMKTNTSPSLVNPLDPSPGLGRSNAGALTMATKLGIIVNRLEN